MRNILTGQIDALHLSPADAAPAAAAKKNRYDVLFTGYTIKHSSPGTTTYGDEGKRKSKKLADVTLNLRDGCGVVTGKIQAVQNPGKKAPVAVFSFTSSLRGGSALLADTDAAQRDLDNYTKAIEARFMSEYKARQAEGAADDEETVIEGLSL